MSDASACLHPGALAAIIASSIIFGAILMASAVYLRMSYAAKESSKVESSTAVQHALSPIPIAATADTAALAPPSITISVPSVSSTLDDPTVIVHPSLHAHVHAAGDSSNRQHTKSVSFNEPDPLRSHPLNFDELASLQSLTPQHVSPSPNSEPVSQAGLSRVQHMLDDLARLRLEMYQLASRPPAADAPRLQDDAGSNVQHSRRRVKETTDTSPSKPVHQRTASPRKPSPASPRAGGAASPSHQHPQSAPSHLQSKAVPGVVAQSGVPFQPITPRVSPEFNLSALAVHHDMQQQQQQQQQQRQQQQRPWNHRDSNGTVVPAPPSHPARDVQLPSPREFYSDSDGLPVALTPSKSKIARVSRPPPMGSPSEIYVEISRLVAEAYSAVSPLMQQQLQGGNDAAATPPRQHASTAAVTPPNTKSPASPKPALSGGRRPTWRGATL
jgi:hypothetical protein